MIRKHDNYNEYSTDCNCNDSRSRWDGVERRRYRRASDGIDEEGMEQLRYINRMVVPDSPPQNTNQSSSFKLFSSGTALSICFSVLTAVSGFVFGLYKQVTALEYKQQTIFERMDDTKQEFIDLKLSIKEAEGNRLKLAEHISSIEETIMELYRNQQKK